ncbi:hypothetical protein BU23DRAFT_551635 [Bimuria novae-zelandiae CBS 107.79]|uniref:BTB domain-containing protein n=1 Tax=Bimuria novae-zelandiae CBS 107.79 TaxID=1447943 RepID=A0A6A5VF68_9PLEO|nr:hypothetical protein BU23DRAFT_551635 [Bimuria novae-zelandiae CBS 107.79]
MYPAVQGRPVHFHVGQAQMPYDVHSLVLSADSPACKTLLARPLKAPIALPTVSPDDFAALTKWLYEHAPPVFDSSADLSSLCKLWVSAMALGLWQKANTLMRLGMVAAMPSDVLCSIDVVRWVFANTPSSSPLRDYIIAIFVQRSKPDRSFLLQHSPVDGEICSKFNAFAKKFQMARHKFAVSKDQGPWGTDENGFPTFDYKKVLALKGEQEPLPLPPYLVWDEKAVELPDCFFIFPGTLTYVEGLAAVLK